MKKIISTLAILLLITSFGYAQREYSREYLVQLSKTELESSLLETKKLERNGTIVAIIGGSAVVVGTGIAVYSHNHGTMDQACYEEYLINSEIEWKLDIEYAFKFLSKIDANQIKYDFEAYSELNRYNYNK